MTISSEGLIVIHDLAGFLTNPDSAQIRAALATVKVLPSGEEGEMPEERVAAILLERAQKHSQPAARTRGVVREVVLTGGITPVSGTPEYIPGLCAIHGEILSLVDLRALFSISGRGLTDLNRVIVISDGTMTFGILAYYITGIATIPASIPSAPAPYSSTDAIPYLLGVVEGVVVLDGAAHLSDPRMLIDETSI